MRALQRLSRRFKVVEPIRQPRALSSSSEVDQIRRDLAAAHRLSHYYGYDDLIWNHISARTAQGFLVSPADKLFNEVGPDDLVISSKDNLNVTADVIHSAIYNARPDVGAIVHHHTTAVVAVAALESGLQYISQDSAAFYGRVAYHDWEGLSDSYDECQRIAAKVSTGATTVLMRNHGCLTLGATVAEAWVRHYYLDRICRVQVAVGSKPNKQLDTELLEHAAKQYAPGSAFAHGALEWPALLRLADRLEASSHTGRHASMAT